MFGHQDDNTGHSGNNDESATMDALAAEDPNKSDHQAGNNAEAEISIPEPPLSTPVGPSTTNQPLPDPADDEEQNKDVLSPAGGYPKPPSQRVHLAPDGQSDNSDEHKQAEEPKPEKEDSEENLLNLTTTDLSKDDLAALKIQALDELYPLIDKLDLHPEERFRIVMMMLQASDNQELVKTAYEAAHGIRDEKAKAQALLDIVNEINYFTHQPEIK